MTDAERYGEHVAVWLLAQPEEVRDAIVLTRDEDRAFWSYIRFCLKRGRSN